MPYCTSLIRALTAFLPEELVLKAPNALLADACVATWKLSSGIRPGPLSAATCTSQRPTWSARLAVGNTADYKREQRSAS